MKFKASCHDFSFKEKTLTDFIFVGLSRLLDWLRFRVRSDAEVEASPADSVAHSFAGVGLNKRHDLVEEFFSVKAGGGRVSTVDELVLSCIVRWEGQQSGVFQARPRAERVLVGVECPYGNIGVHIFRLNVGRVSCPGEQPVVRKCLPFIHQVALD